MSKIDREKVKDFLLTWQKDYCDNLAKINGSEKEFLTDIWKKETLKGGGITRLLENGDVFEQAGVNFSHVYGDSMPKAATAARPELEGASFEAMGVSIVVHPKNPMTPTSHANLRLFIATNNKTGKETWWFGGGFDLTPYIPFEEDAVLWHQAAKNACSNFGYEVYPKFKKWCDDYFYLAHRNEHRGIGGLFFDDLNEISFGDFDKCFNFIKKVGDAYTSSYIAIINKRKDILYNETHRDFQLFRRGRYVEFNLLYDRGTIFGIQSKGRTESILMSLPPLVKWHYEANKEQNEYQKELIKFITPRNWLEAA